MSGFWALIYKNTKGWKLDDVYKQGGKLKEAELDCILDCRDGFIDDYRCINLYSDDYSLAVKRAEYVVDVFNEIGDPNLIERLEFYPV